MSDREDPSNQCGECGAIFIAMSDTRAWIAKKAHEAGCSGDD